MIYNEMKTYAGDRISTTHEHGQSTSLKLYCNGMQLSMELVEIIDQKADEFYKNLRTVGNDIITYEDEEAQCLCGTDVTVIVVKGRFGYKQLIVLVYGDNTVAKYVTFGQSQKRSDR